ncbi:MAG: MAPEG family protein [Betaproteobacteria bacterium]|nr:MAPEG family protein [Betaproteobacteria bacterium]
MHPIAIACTAILGLLLFGLGLAVSVQRFREQRGMGASDDPKNRLNKLVRAHANTAEFAPFLAVLFLFLGSRDPSPFVLGLIILATACRILLVLGLVATRSLARPNPMRFIGALGTYLTGAALSVMLLASL